MSDQPLDDLHARLERERLDADRLYNDALTALDELLHTAPTPAQPPLRPVAADAAAIATELDALRRAGEILPDGGPAIDRSIKGRLRAFVWRMIGPPLERQRQFNAALIDHAAAHQSSAGDVPAALGALVDAARREFEARERFQARLLAYLRTITVYVDTKDRSLAGHELRDRLALTEQRVMALKRELASRPAAAGDAGLATAAPPADPLEAVAYLGFEDRYRGSARLVRDRVDEYLPLFAGASEVVDVGCGRGELLEGLREAGVPARGIDANSAMVAHCRSRGLDVAQSDAVSFLSALPDDSVGGVAAIQVVEHFEPAYLTRFLDTAYHKMRPGSPLVLETINPACWVAFFESYIRDLTHQRPLHPDTLRYLVESSGFQSVDVRFRRPVPEEHRLEQVDVDPALVDPMLARLAAAVNGHAEKLNARLFSSTDYAIVARR